jgi:hypothetical protein
MEWNTKGRGVHMGCYDKLLDAYERSHPGDDPPVSTLVDASRASLCAKCGHIISPGEQIAITITTEWA